MRVEEADVGMVGVVGAESEGTDRSDGTEGAGGWSQTEATDTADGKGRPEATDRAEETGQTGATAGAPLKHDPLDDPASLEADARAERVDRVAVLYARITAATREFLAAVAECDRHRDWAAEGFGSCAEWLAWRVGLGRNAANERVRVAHALERLPKMSEAMSRGEVSFSKVRAMTRVATAESEAELLELARAGSTAYLERVVRAWNVLTREDEVARERMLHRTRRFSVVPDGEGMYVVRGRLTPEVATVLMRAVDAASDALYRSDDEREETDPAQRRADAVGLLAERALAAGLGAPTTEGVGQTRAGSDGTDTADDDVPVSGSRAERYQVVLHVEPETLAEEGEPGMSELEDGTRVSAETARRLACDSSVVEVTRGKPSRRSHDGGSSHPSHCHHPSAREPDDPDARELRRSPILDIGRRTRSVPPAVRRALEARDRGCRFPGCGGRFTDAHHIMHWADGGETKLTNLVLLCRRHHRRVHEEGWRVCSDATGDAIVFFTPAGKALAAAPPMSAVTEWRTATAPSTRETNTRNDGIETRQPARPRTHRSPSPLERLTRALAERGVDPDWRTNLPTHRYDHDIPWAVEAAAREALEAAWDGADGTGEEDAA